MRTATNVAWLAGPLIVVAYLVASAPIAYAVGRWRMRRALGASPDALDARPADPDAPLGQPGELATALIDAAIALAMATLAWHVILANAPPGSVSSIAVLSAQAVTAWQSVALWVGLAAVVGQIAPVFQRFRGGTGTAPALALTLVYAPVVFSAAVVGWFVHLAISRDIDRALPGALAAAVIGEWLAWIGDIRQGWGMVHGPEVALWVTITAGIMFAAHWSRVVVPRTGPPT